MGQTNDLMGRYCILLKYLLNFYLKNYTTIKYYKTYTL